MVHLIISKRLPLDQRSKNARHLHRRAHSLRTYLWRICFSAPFKWLPPYSVWQWYNFSIHAQFAALEIETDWSLIVCARGGLPFFRGENWCCHLGNIVIVQIGLMAHSRAQDVRRDVCGSLTRRLFLGPLFQRMWAAWTVKGHLNGFKTFCWTVD